MQRFEEYNDGDYAPEALEQYYGTASLIDLPNRYFQDDLKLVEKFQVREGSLQVNSSLLFMYIADAWLLFKRTRMSLVQRILFSSCGAVI